jgi:IS30 family transposase
VACRPTGGEREISARFLRQNERILIADLRRSACMISRELGRNRQPDGTYRPHQAHATRFVTLLHLPYGYGPTAVRDGLVTKIHTLPDQLRRSPTWDQGSEIAAELNDRPRMTLDWDTPTERLTTPHCPRSRAR